MILKLKKQTLHVGQFMELDGMQLQHFSVSCCYRNRTVPYHGEIQNFYYVQYVLMSFTVFSFPVARRKEEFFWKKKASGCKATR